IGQRSQTAQVRLDPAERVRRTPLTHLVLAAVPRGVIGVGVRVHPVGVRLHQERPPVTSGTRESFVHHGQHRGGVVAVDLFGGDAVPDALVRQGRRGGLFVQRYRDRVLVVLD